MAPRCSPKEEVEKLPPSEQAGFEIYLKSGSEPTYHANISPAELVWAA